VATAVEVEVNDKGVLRIPAVHTAVDAGTVVSPETVRAQFEGAAVFGTSIAKSGAITATNGVVDQSNFNNYPVARMNEAPYHTSVHIVNNGAPPAGVGEPGVHLMFPHSVMPFSPQPASASVNCRCRETELTRRQTCKLRR
jgi:isoquinoline 1-oxidoreductase beta subunit